VAKASDILPDNEWWEEVDRQRATTGGGKEELCMEIAEVIEGKTTKSTKSVNEWLAQLALNL
jgi:hypothetical protein